MAFFPQFEKKTNSKSSQKYQTVATSEKNCTILTCFSKEVTDYIIIHMLKKLSSPVLGMFSTF
jgi:hypothetical protein